MTAEILKNQLNCLNFPIQIILLCLPHIFTTSNFKYLPFSVWAIILVITNYKSVFNELKKNISICLLLFSFIFFSLFHADFDILKTLMLSLSASLFLVTKTPSKRQLFAMIGITFLTILIPIFNEKHFLTSIYGHHNTLGLVIIFAMHLTSSSGIKLTYKFAVFLAFLYPLFLTKSRSAFLFLITYLIFQMVFKSSFSFKIKKSICISIFLVCTFGYLTILENAHTLNQVLNKSFSIHKNKSALSLSGRDVLYRESLKILNKNPLGIGGKQSSERFKEIKGVSTPHNLFLKIAVDYGVISLILYFLLFISILKTNSNPYFLSFFLAYHVKMLFESGIPFGFSLASALLIYPPFFLMQPNEKVRNSAR